MKKRKVIIVDVNRDPNGLDTAWKIGAWLADLTGFELVVHAKTWAEAMEDLGTTRWDEIHFYGHAFPGTFCIGTDREVTDDDLAMLAKNTHAQTLVWFRGCASFHGEAGHKFAKRCVRILGCRVAAHTYIIGFPWHSGSHSLRPGQRITWSKSEGATTKKTKSGWPVKSSGLLEPRTMLFVNSSFPEGW